MKQTDFLHTKGKDIIDINGTPIILRGVGLGGWLLPEGYMWKFPKQGDRPSKIEKVIESLIGQEDALKFWESYYTDFMTESDINKIADDGFNSIRIPLHWRFLISEDYGIHEHNWEMIDKIIHLCEKRSLYVILDLHSAPGGQTGANIDDSPNDVPELFINPDYQDLTVFIWKALAKRYKDSTIVACYDLLNEPVPEFHGTYTDRIYPFYERLISEIRKIDPYHMITLEGAHWSTDWSIFTHKLDDNVLYQFHKYWNSPDIESIQSFLDLREKWDVPIIMGEGGENNKEWYSGAFAMYEDLSISWNFWTYKKMDTTNSMASIKRPKGWNRLVEYMEHEIPLSKFHANEIFNEYLHNIKLENCDLIDDVVNYLFRRPPVDVPAIFYTWDEKAKTDVVDNVNIGYRISDARGIAFLNSSRTRPNFQHGAGESWAEDDWLCVRMRPTESLGYWFNIIEEQSLSLVIELIVHTPSKLTITWDEEDIELDLDKDNQKAINVLTSIIKPGKTSIKVVLNSGDISLIKVGIR
jgi:endoglucanase